MTRHHPQPRIPRLAAALALLPACVLLLGSSNGEWLRRVSTRDHARTSPLATSPERQDRAARAGAQLFYNECAKCHANDGGGLHGRPSVISDRIASASDGDLFWLMTNGNPWHGMPAWIELPSAQRWQLVAYLRQLNRNEIGPPPQAKPTDLPPPQPTSPQPIGAAQ